MSPFAAPVAAAATKLRHLFRRGGTGSANGYRRPASAPRSATIEATECPAAEVVVHHLRLFGLRGAAPPILDQPGSHQAAEARAHCGNGRSVIALRPRPDFCREFGIEALPVAASPPLVLNWAGASDGRSWPWHRLRTLHPLTCFAGGGGTAIVTDAEPRQAAWLWVPCGPAGVLLVGTWLAEDLVRYRQGDPVLGETPDTAPKWGIAGERPMYLFEPQLAGEAADQRHADWWAMALASALAEHVGGLAFDPILPGGAPGAVLITGDDDQAHLDKYEEQLQELGDLPITYFLHPLTRHDRASMARMFDGRRVDLGIHPDALDAPDRYDEMFAEQLRWYRGLCGGGPPLSVRNHGFLNRGYWGHLPAWLAGGVRFSSNLPGLNGRALNGSLLPARVVWRGELTTHWSILTAIGDGIVFALGMSAEQSAACILDLAADIRRSGVPGIIVLNLHPQNIERTLAMHRAVRQVADSGFIAWTMRDCLRWFERSGEAGFAPEGAVAAVAAGK